MTQEPPFELLLTVSRIQHRVPRRTLSPHTAQHFQISLGLSSVTIGAEYLHVVHAVCILWVFEPCICFDVINLYFPKVEFFLASCTDRAISEEYFFPQFSLPWPVFSVVDIVIAEKVFTLHAFLFLLDFVLFGVRVVPGFRQKPLGLILGWHDQRYCAVSKGVSLSESLHYCWHVALVFTT